MSNFKLSSLRAGSNFEWCTLRAISNFELSTLRAMSNFKLSTIRAMSTLHTVTIASLKRNYYLRNIASSDSDASNNHEENCSDFQRFMERLAPAYFEFDYTTSPH